MREAVAWSLAAIFAVLAIFLFVSYAFECLERRKLERERISWVTKNLCTNESLFNECNNLRCILSQFQHLCHLFGCVDSNDLRTLIIDLRNKLILQEKKTYKESRRCCLAWLEYFNLREDEFGGEYYRRWIKRWARFADYYKKKITEGKQCKGENND